MHYQSFPGQQGNSLSADKLSTMRFPDLTGKRFLDLGCNEGFFCGYAQFSGAAEVVGLDQSAKAIRKAQKRFPECRFLNQSWDTLPEGEFDVILLASSLHYADEQEEMIHRLMQKLTPEGLLVLEVGIAPGGKDDWINVKRSIDERLFPTRTKLGNVLKPYAWKIIGHSVKQQGDPLQRYVVHISPMKPFVYLILEPPGTGKTTIGRTLFVESGVTLISGDRLYGMVARDKATVSQALEAIIKDRYKEYEVANMTRRTFDWGDVTRRVIDAGLLIELVDFWMTHLGIGDAAIDSYVPEEHQERVRQLFEDNGYVPVLLKWQVERSMCSPRTAQTQAEDYQVYLEQQSAKAEVGVSVTRLKPNGLRWHLDRPTAKETLLPDESLLITGWVVPDTAPKTVMQSFVRYQDQVRQQPFKRSRPDVIEACFGATYVPDGFKNLLVGFRVEVDQTALAQEVTVGVVLDGVEVPLAVITLGQSISKAGKNAVNRLRKKLRV